MNSGSQALFFCVWLSEFLLAAAVSDSPPEPPQPTNARHGGPPDMKPDMNNILTNPNAGEPSGKPCAAEGHPKARWARKGRMDGARKALPYGDDRRLVALLLEDDNAAWAHCIANMILPSLGRNAAWREIAAKSGTPPEAVASMVYSRYKANGFAKLREFRFDCSLRRWFCGAIGEIVHDLWRRYASEQIHLRRLHEMQLANRAGDAVVQGPHKSLDLRERLDHANVRLAALWAKRPAQILALLLREAASAPARDVAYMLGFSPCNIDQMKRRATLLIKGRPNAL